MAGRVSEMTHVAAIKQGLTSQLTVKDAKILADPTAPPVRWVDNLRFVLGLVELNASFGNPTPLDDIATIHFARWVVLPGDEQLLFTSNFDGSYEQYIHDFVYVANSGVETPHNSTGAKWMDAIWGHCVGYPGTTDFEAFLDYIESGLIDTTLWYPTIADVTVRDTAWLQKFRRCFVEFDQAFQSVPRSEIPADVLAAYDRMKAAITTIDVRDV